MEEKYTLELTKDEMEEVEYALEHYRNYTVLAIERETEKLQHLEQGIKELEDEYSEITKDYARRILDLMNASKSQREHLERLKERVRNKEGA